MNATATLRFLSLVKAAGTLSEQELASLLPTKDEAGESSTARGFGHMLHGPVTSRRYGSARTIADATGQRTPFLNKHPRTGDVLSALAGAGIGGLGGLLAGEGVNRSNDRLSILNGAKPNFHTDTGATLAAGAAGGAGIGAIIARIMAAKSRAKGVEGIRENARHLPVDRNIDPNVSLPGWLQLSTGDYDRGVSDAHRVFQGGRNQRVRPGDNLIRTLRALSSTMGGTGIGEAAGVVDMVGQVGRKYNARETIDRTQDRSA